MSGEQRVHESHDDQRMNRPLNLFPTFPKSPQRGVIRRDGQQRKDQGGEDPGPRHKTERVMAWPPTNEEVQPDDAAEVIAEGGDHMNGSQDGGGQTGVAPEIDTGRSFASTPCGPWPDHHGHDDQEHRTVGGDDAEGRATSGGLRNGGEHPTTDQGDPHEYSRVRQPSTPPSVHVHAGPGPGPIALEGTVRIAIVGLGYATSFLHLPAIAAIPHALIVGGSDPMERARLGPAFPTFALRDEMLDATRPDVVVIASPPADHAESCIAAMEAGAHVICEKPFVSTLEEADRVLDVARRTGRTVTINQEFRFMPIFAAVRTAMNDGSIGRPVFAQCTQFMDLAPWDEKVPWRAEMSDRSLFEGGVHLVDLLHWCMGGPPIRVTGQTSSGLDGDRKADAIHLVTLEWPNGAIAQITINRLAKIGTRYVDIRVDGESGSAVASYGGRAQMRVGLMRGEKPGLKLDFGLEGEAWLESGHRRKSLARNRRGAAPLATAELYRQTAEAISSGSPSPVPASDARATLRTILASYESSRVGKVVELPRDGSSSDGSATHADR